MSLYQHFRHEEHAFIDRVLDWADYAANRHQVKLTDFLDPRQAFILASTASTEPDIIWKLDGGSDLAERQRAVIAPDYYHVDTSDFGMAVLAVTSEDQRFEKITHGDVLGALLGLGIKREKLGDIHLHSHICHCVVAEEIAEFLYLHLQQVHRVQVQTEILPISKLMPKPVDYSEMQFTAASMRLDAVMSEAVRLSRAKMLPYIKAGACKVNWKVEQDPSAQLQTGDVVSLKGYGRYRILDIDGPTKKGRIRVSIGKYL